MPVSVYLRHSGHCHRCHRPCNTVISDGIVAGSAAAQLTGQPALHPCVHPLGGLCGPRKGGRGTCLQVISSVILWLITAGTLIQNCAAGVVCKAGCRRPLRGDSPTRPGHRPFPSSAPRPCTAVRPAFKARGIVLIYRGKMPHSLKS